VTCADVPRVCALLWIRLRQTYRERDKRIHIAAARPRRFARR
jgi:hypothetical protein